MTAMYNSLGEIVCDVARIIKPPERITVSQAAEKYRYLYNPGSYTGPWKNEMTPYMVEPMDVLGDRHYEACIFAGPAQCGKTDALIINFWLYNTVCDPMDQMLVQTSQSTARDFSKRRIDRLHRHSKKCGEQLLARRDADNTYDKYYRSGAIGTLSWPSINELSGRPIGRMTLTDYDRMPEDIDGEGSPFDLARKRATTFGSSAMTLAESSPGYEITDPKYKIAKGSHEAPPTRGILSLYNQGDRRRWHWPCVHCKEYFEPTFDKLVWDGSEKDFSKAAATTLMQCPHCNRDIEHRHKYEMNLMGVWLKEGQRVINGEVVGVGLVSEIASFWLQGVAAAFISWEKIVLRYLKAMDIYERLGTEEALKSTVNTDQGCPYMLMSLADMRTPEELQDRAQDFTERTVPQDVRFLLAEVDVQGNRFEVMVVGQKPNKDRVVVDRFAITKSKRKDRDGDPLPVDPGAYPEDWKLLVDQVINKTYPLDDDSGRYMRIKMTGCDSGGKAGVTEKAYDFWKKVVRKNGLANRFHLLRGEPKLAAPRIEVRYPDNSGRKDRKAEARGEIPVLFINSNMMKDALDKDLRRTEPGGGLIEFPSWLPDEFYQELCVEIKNRNGKWEAPKGERNESWDLLYYDRALFIKVGGEAIDWNAPPTWAQEWDHNSLVSEDAKPAFTKTVASSFDMESLGKELGGDEL